MSEVLHSQVRDALLNVYLQEMRAIHHDWLHYRSLMHDYPDYFKRAALAHGLWVVMQDVRCNQSLSVLWRVMLQVTGARYCMRCGIMPDMCDLNSIMLEIRANA